MLNTKGNNKLKKEGGRKRGKNLRDKERSRKILKEKRERKK